jgi:hypothetical protein
MLRIPQCLDNRLTDGGKVVSPTHPSHSTPQKHYYLYVSDTHFCQRLSKPQCLMWPERLGTGKNCRQWIEKQPPMIFPQHWPVHCVQCTNHHTAQYALLRTCLTAHKELLREAPFHFGQEQAKYTCSCTTHVVLAEKHSNSPRPLRAEQ